MFMFITELPQMPSILEGITIQHEYCVSSKREEKQAGCYIFDFPNEESCLTSTYSFVYGLFFPPTIPFSTNQPEIINFSKKLFDGCQPLGEFEENVLNQTFERVIKKVPLRLNRK